MGYLRFMQRLREGTLATTAPLGASAAPKAIFQKALLQGVSAALRCARSRWGKVGNRYVTHSDRVSVASSADTA